MRCRCRCRLDKIWWLRLVVLAAVALVAPLRAVWKRTSFLVFVVEGRLDHKDWFFPVKKMEDIILVLFIYLFIYFWGVSTQLLQNPYSMKKTRRRSRNVNNLRDSKAEEKSWVVVPAAAEVGNPVVAQDTELVAQD